MMSWEQYLAEHYAKESIKMYLREVRIYLESINAETVTYKEVVSYIGTLRERGYAINNIKRILAAIKVYHLYLVRSGKRMDNPCSSLILRDHENFTPHHELFTESELNDLQYRENRYEASKVRNRVLLSLLVNQALAVWEIVKLTVKDVDLSTGVIRIKGSRKHEGRELSLHPNQILIFQMYLLEDRPSLLAGKASTNSFLVTLRGKAITADDIHYFISTFQWQFPDRKITPTAIRQSVIVNRLKNGEDICVLRYFTGHKFLSSLERYKPNEIARIQLDIDRCHPLK